MFKSTFEEAVLDTASQWTYCKEDPKRPNRSSCVDKIHLYSVGKVWSEPWCAEFAYMIVGLTCERFGIKNKLPRTASTRTMLAKSPGMGLVVDKTPANGSIFFLPRTSNPAFGHVGFVYSMQDDGSFASLEGNYKDRVAMSSRTPDSRYRFIHVENMTMESKYIMPALPLISKYNFQLPTALVKAIPELQGVNPWFIYATLFGLVTTAAVLKFKN